MTKRAPLPATEPRKSPAKADARPTKTKPGPADDRSKRAAAKGEGPRPGAADDRSRRAAAKGEGPRPGDTPARVKKPPSTEAQPWIAVAEIARPHGVRGELRLKIYSGDPTLLQRRPPIQLRDAGGKVTAGRIAATRHADKALLVQLEGIVDRDAAERMRGKEILVERKEFAPLEEDEFYACDIEGARAELVTGELVGTVTGLGSYPTCDVLLIDRDGARIEVPILPHFVDSIDAAAKLVKLVTVDGLS